MIKHLLSKNVVAFEASREDMEKQAEVLQENVILPVRDQWGS